MIREVSQLNDTNFMSDEELEVLVNKVLMGLVPGSSGLEQATLYYNSKFFENESATFRQKLCAALSNFYLPQVNNYWNTFK